MFGASVVTRVVLDPNLCVCFRLFAAVRSALPPFATCAFNELRVG